jgi:hypothetical protein
MLVAFFCQERHAAIERFGLFAKITHEREERFLEA